MFYLFFVLWFQYVNTETIKGEREGRERTRKENKGGEEREHGEKVREENEQVIK